MTFDAAWSEQLDKQLANGFAPAPLGTLEAAKAAWSQSETPVTLASYSDQAAEELRSAFRKATGQELLGWAAQHMGADAAHFWGRNTASLDMASTVKLAQSLAVLPEEQRQAILPHVDVQHRAAELAAEAEQQRAERQGRTYGLTANALSFVADTARQAVDPVNLAASAIPVGRASSFLGFLGREGLSNAGAQALQEIYIQPERARLGLDAGLTQAASDIAQAGLGGVGMGVAIKAGAIMLKGAARGIASALGVPKSVELHPGSIRTPDGKLSVADLDATSAFVDAQTMASRAVDTPDARSVKIALDSEAMAKAAVDSGQSLSDLPQQPFLRSGEIVLTGGRSLDTRWQVVEASKLITSHAADGTVNPSFPAELQPRDRSRPASIAQVKEIAAKLDPRLLMDAPSAREGSPVVGPDAVVESGNGRVLAIREAYANDLPGAAAYRQALVDAGFPAKSMKEPVLVRVRKTELSPAERIAFTQEANRTATARMSVSERAVQDAGQITPAMMDSFAGGGAEQVRNVPFARKALQAMATPEEWGDLVTSDGFISQAGVDRLTAALVQKGWDAPDVVKALFETTDASSRAIIGAMSDVAPLATRVRQAGAEGRLAFEDPAKTVVAAFRLVERARKSGQKVADLVVQVDLEHGAVSKDVADAVRLFFHDDATTIAAGRERVAERLRVLFSNALRTGDGPDLFGFTVTPEAAFGAAKIAGADIEDLPIAPGSQIGTINLDQMPLQEWEKAWEEIKQGQPFDTVEALHAASEKHQEHLVEIANALAEGNPDIVVKNPGTKSLSGLSEKMTRKGYASAKEITDAVRLGFSVKSEASAQSIFDALSQRFRVLDEGWKATDAGYVDRKIIAIMPDGLLAEIQIWPDAVLAAKKAGHKLYEARRSEQSVDAKAARLSYEKRYWQLVIAEIKDKFPAAYSAAADIVGLKEGGIPKSTPTRADAASSQSIASAADIGRAVPSNASSRMTSRSTAHQPDLGSPVDALRTNASGPEMTASRRSQLYQTGAEPGALSGKSDIASSNGNVGGARRAVNPQLSETIARGQAAHADLRSLLDEAGDFDVEIEGPDGSPLRVPVRQLLEEIDAEASVAAEFSDCVARSGVSE